MNDLQAPWIGPQDYEEPEVAHYCEYCDTEIYVGQDYYHIGDHTICENCISHYLKTAEED